MPINNMGAPAVTAGTRIALDIRQLCLGPSGDRTHLLGLLREFSTLAADDQFLLCLNQPCPEALADLPASRTYHLHSVRSRPGWLWTPVAWPRLLRRERAQVAHGVYLVPPLSPCPTVVTIHDVSFLAHPEWFPPQALRIMRVLIPLSARRATRVVTATEHAASEIVRLTGVPRSKISVIPYGVDERFVPVDSDEARQRVSEVCGLSGRYLIAVGLLQPRKNLTRLLQAFALIAPDHPDVKLAVVGATGWGNELFHERLRELRLEDRVVLCGSVPGEDLPALYSAAEMLVYPSLYEGFGLPPLEAMRCGTPVVASNATSIPEVVGDAAVLIDPLEPESIAAGIKAVLDDAKFAAELSQKGLQRASDFTWPGAAEAYLKLFHEVAKSETA
ncbi:MAG: glycosyltransferase family 4 protein [Armatimonadota bacterium]